jgi:hypothetical protein
MSSSRPHRVGCRRGLVFVLASFLAAACLPSDSADRTDPAPVDAAVQGYAALPAGFQRGMNLEPIRGFGRTLDLERLPASLDALVQLGVDHVAIIPSFFQRELGDGELTWRGGRETVEAETAAAIRLAHDRGLGVLLKPHLWLENRSNGAWRGDIDPPPAVWPAWSEAYSDAVLGFAALAARESVAGLSIGSELSSLTRSQPEYWGELAREVRAIFPGFVTYAANWHQEFDELTFWQELDYVGVDAFWPLADGPDESLDAAGCARRMGAIRDSLQAVSERTGRPVLLTEIGYKSSTGGLWQPWEWSGDEPDPEAQAQAWRCIAEVLGQAASAAATATGAVDDTAGGATWLRGVYAWNWHANLRYGGPRNVDFTLRGKPAEGVLRAWFGSR